MARLPINWKRCPYRLSQVCGAPTLFLMYCVLCVCISALSELFSSDVDASATALATASISRLVRTRGSGACCSCHSVAICKCLDVCSPGSGVRPALISCLSSIPVSTATSGHLKKHKRKKGARCVRMVCSAGHKTPFFF